jgi:hypothetical protein
MGLHVGHLAAEGSVDLLLKALEAQTGSFQKQ